MITMIITHDPQWGQYSSTIEGKGEEKGEKERQVKLKSEEEVEKDRHIHYIAITIRKEEKRG